jgi:AAHS family 4-hydroxybenzoate transporter-like MFS transporter
MADGKTVDISRLIDERGLTRFNIGLLLCALFIIMIDGYDLQAIGVAVPLLVKAWHVTDRAAVGPVLSATLIGGLVGALIFGAFGDRFGRKQAIIVTLLLFGGLTWLAAATTSLREMAVLRFLAGIGIGGFTPNIMALVAEYAPRRMRATMIVVLSSGIAFGAGLPALVALTLVPAYGWQAIFVVGGFVPVAVAILCLLALPESIKFLTIATNRRDRIAALLRRLAPERHFAPDAVFVVADEPQYSGISPKHLFADGLAVITPLLWLLFAMNLMGLFFIASWTPYVLHAAHLPLSEAVLTQTVFQIAGAAGSFVLARPMDNHGLIPVTAMFALAVLAVALTGYVGPLSEALLMTVMAFAGFCIIGLQSGLNAVAASVYPTSYRSNGIGWAGGLGRCGAILGPVIGGFLIAQGLTLQQLYLAAALPLVIGTAGCYVLSHLYARRFRETGLGQPAQPFESAAAEGD